MRATEIAPKLLLDIVKGNIKASENQVTNAIAILGEIGEPAVVASLVAMVEQRSPRLQFHALAALAQIGVDDKTKPVLIALAHDEKAAPALVAYALQALKAADDPSLGDYFRDDPPAHLEDDDSVRKALEELVGRKEQLRRTFARHTSATEHRRKHRHRERPDVG
jgi:hypothetical protein